jgi:NADH-quinone oxidoreductase subunit M
MGPDSAASQWLFLAFVAAFAIKSPMFPLHTWLPDVYVEAPTGATVMLAALLSKMGVYGFIRLAFPLFPVATRSFAPMLAMLAIIGIVYGAALAMKQTNIKRMLAYSSISHVGLILLGAVCGLSLTQQGNDIALTGAVLQMVNHGITTGALFLLAGYLYQRRGTLETDQFGGLCDVMPKYSIYLWVILFASVGLPGLNGFVGEYLILQGTMADGFLYAAGGALGIILGAIYMLRMYRRVMFGEVTVEENRGLRDIHGREAFAVAALAIAALVIGVAPHNFLEVIGNRLPQPSTISMVNPSSSIARVAGALPYAREVGGTSVAISSIAGAQP